MSCVDLNDVISFSPYWTHQEQQGRKPVCAIDLQTPRIDKHGTESERVQNKNSDAILEPEYGNGRVLYGKFRNESSLKHPGMYNCVGTHNVTWIIIPVSKPCNSVYILDSDPECSTKTG